MSKDFAVRKKKLFEEVIEQFETLLQSKEYKIGDKLPSLTELTAIFEVGKPTLREALSVLSSMGVLEIKQGSGIFLKRLSLHPEQELLSKFNSVGGENLLYWLEFRRAIEVEAAGLAAERRSEEDIQELERIQKKLEEEINQGEIASELDYQFHFAITKAACNPIFTEAITANAHLLQQQFFEDIRQTVEIHSRRELIISEHRKIIESIKGKRVGEARQSMLKHINNAERKMKLIGISKSDQ
ncbi:FadR/GntR family transcriptional regulator [Metabacillus idriensis]|uniref:FadR/GntR family transcriptional regulator n=1 Tax=Metabacillus idriensis TaxID=324768 RepID=UPI00174971F0|nr:FadR/GntR family transcriptional regulator [Metabacillus idriensis]